MYGRKIKKCTVVKKISRENSSGLMAISSASSGSSEVSSGSESWY